MIADELDRLCGEPCPGMRRDLCFNHYCNLEREHGGPHWWPSRSDDEHVTSATSTRTNRHGSN